MRAFLPVMPRLLLYSVVCCLVFEPCSPVTGAEPVRLPLKQVSLLRSGVGYFEHSGEINGPQTIELTIQESHLNDVLKSLVISDPAAEISATYTIPEAPSETLPRLSVDLSVNQSLAQIFHQLRGQDVQLLMENETVSGTIVGLEKRTRPVAATVVKADYVLIATKEGLEAVPIDEILKTRFTDPAIQDDVRESLATLKSAGQNRRQTILVHCPGQGSRTLKIGYVHETPVWKVSYRINTRPHGMGILQGWATIEHTGVDPWKDVSVILYGGNPISFELNMSLPTYRRRWWMPDEKNPDELNSEFSGMPGVSSRNRLPIDEFMSGTHRHERSPKLPDEPRKMLMADGLLPWGEFVGTPEFQPNRRLRKAINQEIDGSPPPPMEVIEEDVKETSRLAVYRHSVSRPISLDPNKAIIIPILNHALSGEPVIEINTTDPTIDDVNFSGVLLVNRTDVTWPSGPVIVALNDEYVGEGFFRDVPPGEWVIARYGVDRRLTVNRDDVPDHIDLDFQNFHTTGKGLVFHYDRSCRNQFSVVNQTGKECTLICIQSADGAEGRWIPAALQTVSNQVMHRIEIPSDPRSRFTIARSLPYDREIPVASLNAEKLRDFLDARNLPDKAREVLASLLALKLHQDKTDADCDWISHELKQAIEEFERDSRTIQSLKEGDALRTTILERMTKEDEAIQKLRGEVEKARSEAAAARKAFDNSFHPSSPS